MAQGARLSWLQKVVHFIKKVVPQCVEFGNPAYGFRFPPVSTQRKDFDRQRVELLVQCINVSETKEPATSWQCNPVDQRCAAQPGSESALVEIQRWCTLPHAIEEILDGHDPDSVLDARIVHWPVAGVEREYILPLGIRAPGRRPCREITSLHRSCGAVTQIGRAHV